MGHSTICSLLHRDDEGPDMTIHALPFHQKTGLTSTTPGAGPGPGGGSGE